MTFHRKCTLNCAAVLTVSQQFDGLLSLSVSVPGACQVTARPQGEAANTEALRQCSWLCDLGPVLCSRRVTVGVAGEEGPVRRKPRAFCSLGNEELAEVWKQERPCWDGLQAAVRRGKDCRWEQTGGW